MATQLQIRRGTTAQMNAFTGAEGELAVNTSTDTVHVHDGSTAGGFALAKADGSNIGTYAGSFTTISASGAITGNVTGNLTGNVTGNVTGDVTGDLTGSVLTAAQTNITSVGTLSTLAVTGTATVDGGLTVTPDSSANAANFRTRSTNDYSFVNFYSNDGSENLASIGIQRTAASTSGLHFYVNNGGQYVAKKMSISPEGNVGIGTDIITDFSGTVLQLHASSGSAARIKLTTATSGTATSDGGSITFDTSNNLTILNRESAALIFGTSALERMRLDQSGNLALMTDGAEIKLYYTEPRKFISNSGASVTIKQIDNDTSSAYIDFASWTNSSLMRLMNSGNLLVGTTSIGNASTNAKVCTDSEFLSRGTAAGYFWENRTGMTIASQSGWGGWYSTGTASHFLYSDGQNRASIGRTSGTYTALSDVNKKKDFEDSTVGLAAIMQLQPKKFRMLDDADDAPKYLGFVAQDVENVIPEAYVEDTSVDAGGVENTFIGLTDRPFIAALVKAIQEQQATITALEARITQLENN